MTTMTETAVKVLNDLIAELEAEGHKEERAQAHWAKDRFLRLALVQTIAQVGMAKELEEIREFLTTPANRT